MPQLIGVGDVVLISLPSHDPRGHEQEGLRPAIIVGLPDQVGTPRYPTVLVVPLTTQDGAWAQRSPHLYPRLRPGTGGLPRPSVVLLDQFRSVDARRVNRYLGRLTADEFQPISDGIQQLFGAIE